ncbi:MAG: selenocysteine-specific translation elongation factor [Planctomycetota bacterium]
MTTTRDTGIFNVIIGTAGHIDHGKSTLVQKLTGIHPDRLKEEQERGMTIDLGFAPYRTRQGKSVGIIDVPGHERFVKNMVAGATSVDIVLLVIAADDGVMPQTREHLEIMGLLGIARGLIVLTKRDLVDADYLALAIEDVRDLVKGTFLASAPILPISNTTGEGLDQLQEALEQMIAATPQRTGEGLFRMPVQRVFSAKGHGTVLTGVPVSGRVTVGDTVEVLPLGRQGRVRGIQAYKLDRTQAIAGHSTALNLAEIDFHQVERGATVAAPGYFRAERLFEGRMRYLENGQRPLRPRSQIRFHVGTAEILGVLTLLDKDQLMPGEDGLVQIALEDPVVAVAGDRFLVRLPSPMETIGGGVILGESRRRLKRLKAHVIDLVKEKEDALTDEDHKVIVALKEAQYQPLAAAQIAIQCKRPRDEIESRLERLVAAGVLRMVSKQGYLTRESFAAAVRRVLAAVAAFHAHHPLRKWMELRDLRGETRLPDATLLEAIEAATESGSLIAEKGGRVRSAAFTPQLNEKQELLLELLRASYATADVNPPSVSEVASKVARRSVVELIRLLVEEGELVKVGEHFFHRTAIERVERMLIEDGRKHGGEVNIPSLRDVLQTSRKYMIPLLEHFDGVGLTVRRGDRRILRSRTDG